MRRSIDGQDSRVVAADIHSEPGKWSGIKFTAPEPLDWTGLEEIAVKVRWNSTDDAGAFAFVLEDVQERSWRWYPNPTVFPPDDQGWSTWDLVLWEADQQDDGFRWDQIKWVSVSAFSDSEAAASDSVLELGPVHAVVAPPGASNPGRDFELSFWGLSVPVIIEIEHPGIGAETAFVALQDRSAGPWGRRSIYT